MARLVELSKKRNRNGLYVKTIGQGAISNDIFFNEIIVGYTGNYARKKRFTTTKVAAGYIGDFARTKKTDALVMKLLLRKNLTYNEIAEWLTSSSGRHMMDDGGTKSSIRDYINHAEEDIARWKKAEVDYRLKELKSKEVA